MGSQRVRYNWATFIVDLQCCVSLRCIAKWFRYIYMYVYIYIYTHTHTYMCAYISVLSGFQLCNPMDCSPPGFSVHRIFQARILEWITISSFRGSFQLRDRIHVSCISCIGRWILYHYATWEVHLCVYTHTYTTPWTVAIQAPSMGFSRQEYWSG